MNNALIIFPGERKPVIFDHILIADKYVYVIKDVYYDGAIYGNLKDPSLFHEDLKKKVEKIENPLYVNAERIAKLEQMVNVQPDARLFVNVVCYNKALLVQDGLKTKEQGLFFLPVNELEKTIDAAEADNVQPISHEKSERLINLFKERSERIKKRAPHPKKKLTTNEESQSGSQGDVLRPLLQGSRKRLGKSRRLFPCRPRPQPVEFSYDETTISLDYLRRLVKRAGYELVTDDSKKFNINKILVRSA